MVESMNMKTVQSSEMTKMDVMLDYKIYHRDEIFTLNDYLFLLVALSRALMSRYQKH